MTTKDESKYCESGALLGVQRTMHLLHVAVLDHLANVHEAPAAIGNLLGLLERVHELVQPGKGIDSADAVGQALTVLGQVEPRASDGNRTAAHCCWPYRHDRGTGDCVWVRPVGATGSESES